MIETILSRPEPAVVRPTFAELVALSRSASGPGKLFPAFARGAQSGQYLSRFKARGMEFDESRPYSPGDEARNLDWRVTARTGLAHTKLFKEERERPLFLSIDQRAAMFFATRGMYKSAMAVRLAALVAWSACRHGDRVGGQVFSEAGQTEFRPEHGRPAILRLLKALVRDPPAVSGQAGNALEAALVRLPRHARPGSLVFVFSDFRQFSPACESALARLSRHCDVVLVMIHDPLEQHLPVGRHRYGFQGQELVIDATPSMAETFRQCFQARQEILKAFARGHGMKFIACATTDSLLDVLHRRG